MRSLFVIGGPLILATWFAFHSNLITFANEQPGMVHLAGVEPGGTFGLLHTETYQCDESGANCVLVDERTETFDVEELEFEPEAIEYREGSSASYNKTMQPGLAKFTEIHISRPTGFNWGEWKFNFADR